MSTIKYGFGCLLLLGMLLQLSYASDEIYLYSGDLLHGQVTQITGEYIVIDTVFAKQLKIKHVLISKIMTESEVDILFMNGKRVVAKLHKHDDDAIYYQAGNQTHVLNLSEIANIEDDVLLAKQVEVDKVNYSGSIDIGLSKSSGNEDEDDYHGELMLQARTLKNRFTLHAAKTIEKNDGDKTQDETFGSIQYDRFLNEKWYAFTSASFEEDLEELLNIRSTYSLGSGYQFYEQESLKLKAEIGLAYVDEDFDDEDDEDNSYTGGRWAIDYEHGWFDWIGFYHHNEGFFSLENSDDINIRSRSGFKFPLNDYLNAKLEAKVDWNRSPAQGATGTDKEYLFTLGYEF